MDDEPTGARPRFAAGYHTDPAIVEFKIEWGAGGDRLRCCDHTCDRVTHDDIAARQQALMALGMGSKATGEIVDRAMTATDEAGHGGKQPRLGFGETGAGAGNIGR
jgi:hypothetical protein